MSRLNDLIQELCPNGVEFKTLGEVADINRGVRVVREQLKSDGEFPVYQNSLTPLGYFDQSNQKACTPFVIGAGAAGEIGWSSVDFWAADDCFCLQCTSRLDSRYLYHYLLLQKNNIISKVRRSSVPRLPRNVLENLKIPVPPLPVQREIVQILDNFAELTTKLTVELAAELAARKKQYEYYRDLLLTFPETDGRGNIYVAPTCENITGGGNREFVPIGVLLGDICSLITVGIANSATHAYTDSGIIMFRNQNIKENYLDDSDLIYIKPEFEEIYKTKRLKKNDILITRTGYPGQACVVPDKYEGCQTFTTLIARLRDVNEANPYYICHYINSKYGKSYVNSMKSGAAQQNFGAKALENMPIMLPPIHIQDKIVTFLEKLNSICNDLFCGLPAEIEARRKQYEYYRDKLLTFPEL